MRQELPLQLAVCWRALGLEEQSLKWVAKILCSRSCGNWSDVLCITDTGSGRPTGTGSASDLAVGPPQIRHVATLPARQTRLSSDRKATIPLALWQRREGENGT